MLAFGSSYHSHSGTNGQAGGQTNDWQQAATTTSCTASNNTHMHAHTCIYMYFRIRIRFRFRFMHFKVARTAGGLRGCVRRHFGVKDSDYGSENCHAFMATFANCLLNC